MELKGVNSLGQNSPNYDLADCSDNEERENVRRVYVRT